MPSKVRFRSEADVQGHSPLSGHVAIDPFREYGGRICCDALQTPISTVQGGGRPVIAEYLFVLIEIAQPP